MMDDLIKRQDVIKAIEDLPNCANGYSEVYDKSTIIGTLEEVPPAEHHKLNIAEYIHDFFPDVWKHAEKELEVQPSAQRKGRWIDYGHQSYTCVCSCCGIRQDIAAKFLFSYCPNCGADMRR